MIPEPMDYVTAETSGYGPGQGTWHVEWGLSPVGEVRVDLGSGDWSVAFTLSEGANALEVWAEDAAGNLSLSVWVDILVDSVAPAVTAIWPQNSAFINADPGSVVIEFTEAVSGLDPDETVLSIKDADQTPVAGGWSVSENHLVFTPSVPFADSYYTIDVTLEDRLGNRGTPSQFHFTLDTILPLPPVIDPVISPAYNRNQAIGGTKEAYASILLNGAEIVGHTAGTTWSFGATLQSGENLFSFVAEDRSGNQSESVLVEIVYNDIPPLPVTTLTADGEGTGTTVHLCWAGYDETAHGDIASYRVYYETSGFTDVSGLTARATLPVGTSAYTAQNLNRGQTYWFAVVAVDAAGNGLTAVTPISAVPNDLLPPEPVSRLRVAGWFDDGLIFAWDHSADSHGDLAGYRVYFNNDSDGVLVAAGENTFQKTGLSPATAYPIRVTACDGGGNESSGLTLTGITLLPDPASLSLAVYSGYINLTWSAVSPSQYLKHYAVYVGMSEFETVEGMSPYATTTSPSIKIAGLANNVTYYFAVTSVNLSGGEQEDCGGVIWNAHPRHDRSRDHQCEGG